MAVNEGEKITIRDEAQSNTFNVDALAAKVQKRNADAQVAPDESGIAPATPTAQPQKSASPQKPERATRNGIHQGGQEQEQSGRNPQQHQQQQVQQQQAAKAQGVRGTLGTMMAEVVGRFTLNMLDKKEAQAPAEKAGQEQGKTHEQGQRSVGSLSPAELAKAVGAARGAGENVSMGQGQASTAGKTAPQQSTPKTGMSR